MARLSLTARSSKAKRGQGATKPSGLPEVLPKKGTAKDSVGIKTQETSGSSSQEVSLTNKQKVSSGSKYAINKSSSDVKSVSGLSLSSQVSKTLRIPLRLPRKILKKRDAGKEIGCPVSDSTGSSKSWEWDRLENEIARRMSKFKKPDKCSEKRYFAERQKRWLEYVFMSIEQARVDSLIMEEGLEDEDEESRISEQSGNRVKPKSRILAGRAVKAVKFADQDTTSGSSSGKNSSEYESAQESTTIHELATRTSDDDLSVSSVEVLFNWLTCNEDAMRAPEKALPTGMVVKAPDGTQKPVKITEHYHMQLSPRKSLRL